MRFFSYLTSLFSNLFAAPRTSMIPHSVPAHLTSSNFERGHINTNPNWLKIALNQK